MEYGIQTGSLEKRHSDCLVAGVFAKNHLGQVASEIDQLSNGAISTLLKQADLDKAGATLLLHNPAGLKAERLLLVGLGPQKKYDRKAYVAALEAALTLLQSDPSRQLLLTLGEEAYPHSSPQDRARDAVMTADRVLYRFDQCKSEEERSKAAPRHPIEKIELWSAEKKRIKELDLGVRQGAAIGAAITLTRDLANLPGNLCTPSYLADQATALAGRFDKMQATILEESQMSSLGMGALLSVARGSRQPAKLIVLEYHGGKADQAPIALVGKALTFDAGGISLKPGEGMDEMKYDMCGGASVLGTLQACAELELPINLVGVIPSSENLPDGNANKPGDIVTSMSGKTIEILNTDAEGRLILCDALTYVAQYKPATVIDIATLTGACVIALGHHNSGLLANHQKLADELLHAGRQINDRVWQLPLEEEYQKQLESPFADLANIGGRPGGTITAACFLSRFTEKFKWAHLDIAGTAWTSGKNKGATGRPVPLLVQFVLNRCGME